MKLEILTAARRNPAVRDRCAMGVMTKTPRNGFSKTRLSPPLSSEEAANMSRCFLKDISAAIEALSYEDPFVVGVAIYTPVGTEATLGELLPAIPLPVWYDVDDQLSLNRLLSELFPDRANEAVPQGSPAP